MLVETRIWFRKLLTEDRGIDHLIDADTVIVNQRLGELYNLPGINGAKFRGVKLPPDSPRGGFLTQGSVLKVTADGTATSPVLRGVWITERMLGIEPRLPPKNIPAVEPDATGAKTIRQQLAMHQPIRRVRVVTGSSTHRDSRWRRSTRSGLTERATASTDVLG